MSAGSSKRSSHYIKGVLIGAASTMGLALVVLLALLWVWSLSKKERAVRKYIVVKKLVDQEAGELNAFSISAFHLCFFFFFSISN